MHSDRNQTKRPKTTRQFAVWAIVIVALCGGLIYSTANAADSTSLTEAIWIDIYPLDSVHWTAAIYLENTELLSAMTIPLSWGSDDAPFMIDSAVYRNTRLDYFALKTFSVDTTQQTVLIGLISDLGMGLPPLDSGKGLIAWLHFTRTDKSDTALMLDSTFIPPQNTLQLVTPDVRALTPKFQVRQMVPPSSTSK